MAACSAQSTGESTDESTGESTGESMDEATMTLVSLSLIFISGKDRVKISSIT